MKSGRLRTEAARTAAATLVAAVLAVGATGRTPAAAQKPQSGVAPRPISLAEAIDMAKRYAPAMISAQGQQRTADAGVRSAYAAFLPNVTVSLGSTRQFQGSGTRTRVENGQVITLPDQPWSYNMGVSASVDLFDGGQRIFNLRQAKAQAQISDINTLSQGYSVTLTVKQSYFDVLAAREAQVAAQAQLDQAQQQLRASIIRVRALTATRSDSLRAEIQVRNGQLALLDANTSLDVANATLTRTVGSTTPVTAATEDVSSTLELSLADSTLLAEALMGPAVRQAESSLDAARDALHAAWTDYLPSVSLSFSRSGSSTGSGFAVISGDYAYTSTVRLSFSLPVFNRLQREQQIVGARVVEANAQASLRDAKLAAVEVLAQSLGTFRAAKERVSQQNATLAAAEEDLRVQQQRYALGASTQLDVLTSQTQVDQARHDLIRARYDQRVAKAQLEALIGRDL